ncbi:MAG TPA: hypothetical protein VLM17_00690, partial [Xanthomonadaceae bacterium]|nr:hypothetical protein [Xanthomonadaceae bacterium]
RRLLDHPGERRSHVAATPRGGGVGIVVAMCGALVAGAVIFPAERALALAIVGGLALVAAVGWIDDHRPLSPWLRLLAHALSAAGLGFGMFATGTGLPFALVGAAAALVLTNVWNFMDGIDAIAASQALLVALACALYAGGGPVAWWALALAAACAGFLPFNLPPARIFLGDVGSGALGFLLAALIAAAGARRPADAPLLLLPLSAFLVDATLTLARRIWRGERWWLPHAQHAYQGLARACHRHGPVTAAYALWTVAGVALMRAGAGAGPAVKMLALSGACLGGAIAWKWSQRTPSPQEAKE